MPVKVAKFAALLHANATKALRQNLPESLRFRIPNGALCISSWSLVPKSGHNTFCARNSHRRFKAERLLGIISIQENVVAMHGVALFRNCVCDMNGFGKVARQKLEIKFLFPVIVPHEGLGRLLGTDINETGCSEPVRKIL